MQSEFEKLLEVRERDYKLHLSHEGTYHLLGGFDRKLQSYRLGHGNQGGKAGISVSRKGAVQALALNAGGFSYFGNAASRFRDATQGDQEHAGLVGILQCGAEVFSGELRTPAQSANCGFVVRCACLDKSIPQELYSLCGMGG